MKSKIKMDRFKYVQTEFTVDKVRFKEPRRFTYLHESRSGFHFDVVNVYTR